MDAYLQASKNQKTLRRELLEGTAQKRIHIELSEKDPMDTKFHMDAPTKQEKAAESTHRGMQQIAQRNAPNLWPAPANNLMKHVLNNEAGYVSPRYFCLLVNI